MVISDLRRRIDEIDLAILKLISQRAQTVLKVGKWKEQNSLPVFDPKREDKILTNLIKANPGPLPDNSITSIFKIIIQEQRQLESNSISKDGKAPA